MQSSFIGRSGLTQREFKRFPSSNARLSVQASTSGQRITDLDVVVVRSDNSSPKFLARVAHVSGDKLDVHRLVRDPKEPEVYLEDHDTEPQTILASQVELVVENEYGQRMIQDRVENPHGEHAEEIWTIFEDSFPPGTLDQIYRGPAIPVNRSPEN